MKHFNNSDAVRRQGSIKSPFAFAPVQNKLPRNPFDLSRDVLFTSPAGLLLPNFVQEVQAGDFMKLNVANFSRTQPLNSAAFARIREVTDFFFVPYSLLWSKYKSFKSGVSDYTSNLFSYSPDMTTIPGPRVADVLRAAIS